MKLFRICLPFTVSYGGKVYKLRPAWPNVLIAADVLSDPALPDGIKISAALDLVIASQHPEDVKLLEATFSALNPDAKTGGKKLLDFNQDWEYIVSGILQAYGIDLYTAPRLHWMRLRSMLESIPSNTRIAEIMAIRGMEMPKPTKYNGEERARIARLKGQFAIKAAPSGLSEGLNGLFNALAAQARQK